MIRTGFLITVREATGFGSSTAWVLLHRLVQPTMLRCHGDNSETKETDSDNHKSMIAGFCKYLSYLLVYRMALFNAAGIKYKMSRCIRSEEVQNHVQPC